MEVVYTVYIQHCCWGLYNFLETLIHVISVLFLFTICVSHHMTTEISLSLVTGDTEAIFTLQVKFPFASCNKQISIPKSEFI